MRKSAFCIAAIVLLLAACDKKKPTEPGYGVTSVATATARALS